METIPAFYFDSDELAGMRQRSEDFKSATPFPHVVIDDFLPEDLALALAIEFPGPHDIDWFLAGRGDTANTGDPNIEKLACDRETLFPPLIHHFLQQLNSGVFVKFLEDLTGYTALSPDPTFRGCGMHSTGRGGSLMVHADASRHPIKAFHQIINVIIYVTPDWQEDYGGHLGLWSPDAKTMEKSVTPKFNRCLIFYTGSKSYHGHPHALTCPEGVRRNSLAAYYYTTERQFDSTYDRHRDYVTWINTGEEQSAFLRFKHRARQIAPAWLDRTASAAFRKLFR